MKIGCTNIHRCKYISQKFSVTYNHCYIFLDDGEWHKYVTKMADERIYAASIGFNDALFVSGGYNAKAKLTVKSTSLVYTNGTIKSSKDMPAPLYHHCMAKIYDGNTAIIIGGGNDTSKSNVNKNTYIYHKNNETYTNGPGKSDGFGIRTRCTEFNR